MLKKCFIHLVALLLICPFFFSGTVHADPIWVDQCDIIFITSDRMRVACPTLKALIPSGRNTFIFNQEVSNKLLALALTGMSLEKQVSIRILPDGITMSDFRMLND